LEILRGGRAAKKFPREEVSHYSGKGKKRLPGRKSKYEDKAEGKLAGKKGGP